MAFVPRPLQSRAKFVSPVNLIVFPINFVQPVVVSEPPAKLTSPFGRYSAPPNTWVAPPSNLNTVPAGALRSPKNTIPAVGPEVGAVKLTLAPPLIDAVA